MDPMKINVYTMKGKSKSVTPTYRLIDEDTNTEHDLAYVPPGRHTLPPPSQDNKGTPGKVNPDVVTASKSDDDHIIRSPTRAALGSKRGSTSGSESASSSE